VVVLKNPRSRKTCRGARRYCLEFRVVSAGQFIPVAAGTLAPPGIGVADAQEIAEF